jgi:hypothetical protein
MAELTLPLQLAGPLGGKLGLNLIRQKRHVLPTNLGVEGAFLCDVELNDRHNVTLVENTIKVD